MLSIDRSTPAASSARDSAAVASRTSPCVKGELGGVE